MVPENVEELLERLYLTLVEGQADADPAADADAVADAEAAGLVRREGGTLAFTDAGRAAAVSVIRRHRLAECLLVNVLAMRGESMEDEACRFEHVIAPELETKICSLLGHPRVCPHGKPIPPGPCCDPAHRPDGPAVTSLAEGQPGGAGTVVFLAGRDQGEVQKLMAMGILPGESIRLLRRFPSFVFAVGLSQFTVDRELAQRIQVRWEQLPKPSKVKPPVPRPGAPGIGRAAPPLPPRGRGPHGPGPHRHRRRGRP